MKTILKLSAVIFFLMIMSCKETKKEEEETKTALIEIEAVESRVIEVGVNLEQSVQELEIALKELDSI